ncbi:unnamed protein product, partial [marine sediment metagenome]
RFLDRKHNKGNNEVGWNESERRNFAIRRSRGSEKDILRVELTKAVKSLSLPDEIKESVLGKGYVTTFYRIVDSASARAKLGYDISKDGKIRIKNLSEESRLISGIHDTYGKLFSDLGLSKVIKRPSRNIMAARIFCHIVLARIANPVSKMASVDIL